MIPGGPINFPLKKGRERFFLLSQGGGSLSHGAVTLFLASRLGKKKTNYDSPEKSLSSERDDHSVIGSEPPLEEEKKGESHYGKEESDRLPKKNLLRRKETGSNTREKEAISLTSYREGRKI